jgi:hypothetical protein
MAKPDAHVGDSPAGPSGKYKCDSNNFQHAKDK